MRCKHTAQGAKDFCEEHIEYYQEARDEAFDEYFKDELLPQGVNTNLEKWALTLEDVQGLLDNFDFPDEDDWLASEYESMLGDCADQAYEEYKDRQMGL